MHTLHLLVSHSSCQPHRTSVEFIKIISAGESGTHRKGKVLYSLHAINWQIARAFSNQQARLTNSPKQKEEKLNQIKYIYM